jgi:lipopolysaccharide transport system ATP-binding protein
MHSDIAISVRNLTKTYRLFDHPGDRIKQFLGLGLKQYHREFTALKDISFEIRKGETVGIIGRNGSGKSTLLQVICGILKPTAGSVQVNGRISALLELGAGFNPEFTGRENVYFQGAITGIGQAQMQQRFDAIAAFAEIGDFIDQPVRTYSSGMYLRLAFAVAVHVEPDILIVDEALAVGDTQFQDRCYARIRSMQKGGLTLVVVSHDDELVRSLADRALLLVDGVSFFFGNTGAAMHQYRKIQFRSQSNEMTLIQEKGSVLHPSSNDEIGMGGARISNFSQTDESGAPCKAFKAKEVIRFEIEVLFEVPLDNLNIAIVIRNTQGLKIYSWGTLNQDIAIWAGRSESKVFWTRYFAAGTSTAVCLELQCNLGAGDFLVTAVVSREIDKYYGAQTILCWRDDISAFRVERDSRDYFFRRHMRSARQGYFE